LACEELAGADCNGVDAKLHRPLKAFGDALVESLLLSTSLPNGFGLQRAK
jgi:hypothetical protein